MGFIVDTLRAAKPILLDMQRRERDVAVNVAVEQEIAKVEEFTGEVKGVQAQAAVIIEGAEKQTSQIAIIAIVGVAVAAFLLLR